MAYFSYEKSFTVAGLSFDGLNLDSFIQWYMDIQKLKFKNVNELDQNDYVFLKVLYPLLDKIVPPIAFRIEFLELMNNQSELNSAVNGLMYSSYKVSKCLLELIREHSPKEQNEFVKQIERELKNSLHYVGASLSSDSSRWHYYSLDEVKGYEGLRGDELKTAILLNFRHNLI